MDVLPGAPFTVRFRADTGLQGVFGVRVRDASGVDIIARRTDIVHEDVGTPGIYRANFPAAPAAVGEYEVVGDTGVSLPTTSAIIRLVVTAVRPEPTVVDGAADQNYIPSVDLVARKITSRTRDEYGNALGIFTPATTPTDDQVQQLIFDALTEIADVIGDTVPDHLRDDAANVVAERTAMQVELNFFSSQVDTGRSVYPQLKENYETDLARLSRAIIEFEATGVVGETGLSNRPSYSFPAPLTTLTERF